MQNLVQMTCQRDHLRLEISVLSTFLQLPNITSVRALELLKIDDKHWVRPRTWSTEKQLANTNLDISIDPQRFNLEELPELQKCIAHHQLQTHTQIDEETYTLWLPVWMHEQVHACIEITQSKPFYKHSLDVITGIFNVYKNYQSLLDYSERDALTGLLNRKTFDEHLMRFASGIERKSSTHSPWLAVIDIDHFKMVNDKFGHLFGDEVLILIGNLLRSSFGSQHRIFRFGGEEFVILIPPMSQKSALNSLENFRKLVETHEFPQVGKVTVSVGVAEAKMCSPVEILGQADQALYYAKAHGRNKVCHFEDLYAQGLLVSTQISHDDVELF